MRLLLNLCIHTKRVYLLCHIYGTLCLLVLYYTYCRMYVILHIALHCIQISGAYVLDGSRDELACADTNMYLAINRDGQCAGVVKEGTGSFKLQNLSSIISVSLQF